MKNFRDFMESALYSPSGFYARRSSGEDFYTAPELGPAFAQILAKEVVARLDAASRALPREPLFVVEVGSGEGTLARQLLVCIRACRPDLHARLRYVLIERVERLLLRSVSALGEAGRVLGYSRLADLLPVCGVFLSNELVDALPVHVLERSKGRLRELFVDSEGLPRHGEPSTPELERAARRTEIPEGARHAVSLDAAAWMRETAERLKAGSVITIDYGRRGGGLNAPRAFRRHATGLDILSGAGAQDLTASVDFDALIEAGREAGLETVHFSTLGRFLLDRGILERLPGGPGPADYAERNRVKTLFHPDGMGDCFKVLIQEKRPCAAQAPEEAAAPPAWWRR